MSTEAPGTPGRRHRALWWALAAGALVLVSIVGMVLIACSSAREYIDREREHVRLRLEALESRGVKRPLFFEPAEEGNSWELVGSVIESSSGFYLVDDLDIDVFKQGLNRSWTEPRVRLAHTEIILDTDGGRIFDAARVAPGEGETDRAIDLLAVGWGVADRMTVNRDVDYLTCHFRWQRRGLDVLRRFLRIADLSREHLRRLAALLEVMDDNPVDLREGFDVSDVLLRYSLLMGLEKPENSPWTARIKPELSNLFSSRIAASRWFSLMDTYLQGLETPLRLRGLARWKAVEEWDRRCFEAVDPSFYGDIRDRTEALFSTEALASVHLQLARASVAIARHIQDRGAPPKSLESLVPAYLTSVPTDPHWALPIKYNSDELDAVVYAHGFDGDDDGGRDSADEAGDGDLVWLVRIRIPVGK